MTIKIAEHFHSIQGEGRTAGRQSVFVRLQACNLMCGGYGTQKDGELHDGATWRCDTIEVWLKGKPYDLNQASDLIKDTYGLYLQNGSHLIWTGGEPLLQQEQISKVCKQLKYLHGLRGIYYEVETNGTIMPSNQLEGWTYLFNVSPKLANSGMPKDKRIKPDVLHYFGTLAKNGRAIFKFVVSGVQDFKEIKEIQKIARIPNNAIYIMPACSDAETWETISGRIARDAIDKGYNFSPRLQVALWDKTTGV